MILVFNLLISKSSYFMFAKFNSWHAYLECAIYLQRVLHEGMQKSLQKLDKRYLRKEISVKYPECMEITCKENTDIVGLS